MGMAVTSTNNSALAEAKFSNFYRIETESNFAFALPIIFVPDQIVTMRKVNASSYAIDGGNGGAKGQNVYLWSFNGNNINQQWVEVNRGNGYFSYQKNSTIYALDGGAAGAKGQNLYLWTAGDNNFNQHWAKVQISGNTYRLEKRNASGFSIDGGAGGAKAQNVYLWSSGNNNQNMQWIIE